MATPKQNTTFPDDIDSDSVSITSTVASEPQEEYEVEAILAEEEGDDGINYLIKWEGYPLHRCTWEPESNLYNKSIFQDWTEQKKRISRGHAKSIKNFDQFNQKNIQEFEDAVVEFEEAKEQRKKKRRVKRIKLGLPVVPENEESDNDQEMSEADGEAEGEADDTDDDIPLVRRQRKRVTRDLSRLITDDEELNETSMIVEETRHASPEPLSEDSLMEELTQKSSKAISRPTKLLGSQNQKDIPKERSTKADNLSRKPNDTTARAVESVSRQISRRPKSPDITPLQRALPRSITNASASAHVTNSGVSGSKTGKTTITTMKRTGITMNMSKIPGPKRQWTTGSGAFKTLKMIRRAELRGRNERAPDPEDLEFVDTLSGSNSRKNPGAMAESNNPSASKRGTRRAVDEAEELGASNLGQFNPYSLRYFEGSHKEDNARGFGDASTTPDTALESTSVAVEDLDKVPMTCFNWKNGSCQYNAQQCRFLHHLTDLTCPADGTIPPKFLRPPLTCNFWFFQGCNKTEAECKYAHWNTGLVAQLYNKPPVSVDKSIVPPHSQAESRDQGVDQPTSTSFDKGVTCYYWHKGHCWKPESECMFAHRHTGQVASRRGTFKVPNIPPLDFHDNQTSKSVRQPPAQDIAKILQEPVSPPPPLPPPPPPPLPVTNTIASQAHPFTFAMGPSISTGERQDSVIPDAIKALLVLPGENGQDSHEIEVQLTGFDYTTRGKLRSLVGSAPRFEVKNTCHPNDWKEICDQDSLSSTLTIGDIVPVSSSSTELEAYTQYLRMDSSGGVIYYNQAIMVIYPAQQESWNFLNAVAHPNSQQAHLCKLRIHIRSPVSSPIINDAPTLMLDDEASIKDMKAMLRVNLGIEPDRLFEWPEQSLERRAFLMFDPEEHREELELVTRFLQLERVKIYHSGVPGSWEYFRKHYRSGVIILHPDVYHYWEIPNLRYFLGHSINFFQLGCDLWASSEGLEYTCTRLFPSGSVIFITDDVFVHQPGLAFALVKHFVKEKFEIVPQGSRTWKLAARPGLVPWILRLAEDYQDVIMEGRERDRIRLYERLSELVPPELQDPMDPPNPSKDSSLVSASPKELPHYHALWEQDERRATDFLVKWFAGWACTQATKYRRFVVVHPMNKPEWTDRYNHILDVATPEECIRLYLEPKNKK